MCFWLFDALEMKISKMLGHLVGSEGAVRIVWRRWFVSEGFYFGSLSDDVLRWYHLQLRSYVLGD